ncbi:phenoloxidase-activating factor 1-like [Sitophilus oryzae]|uniref:CLIP domain-containing serine protease n=1 Tax=Sitophilus oryzae TaxID=7048 RepID=A0A6J2YWH2_SITOR|nr:phenoloxidase-activating factor 1-like [Sitophilus oryzae]
MQVKSVFCVNFLLACVYSNSNLNCNSSESIPGLECSNENNTDSDEINTDVSLEHKDFLENISNITDTQSLRFATPCETPNLEITYCVEISKCPVLQNVRKSKKYAAYIEASRCGPKLENQNDFKVCCGRFNNFRNVSNSIDNSIFPKPCGVQKIIMRGRIYGGTTAALKEYPWMARILHKNSRGRKTYGCAGFLIHARIVVTAAHCIQTPTRKIRGEPYAVVLGEHDITTKIDCTPRNITCADPLQQSRISNVIVHPKYDENSTNHYNDIALIQVKKSFKFTDYVQPLCLHTSSDTTINKYYISGWGKTATEEASSVKLKLDLPPVDKAVCYDKLLTLNLEIDETQICAGGEDGKDSCTGDSGGPLMIRDNDSIHYAAGIVSYGIGCGLKNWPGIYTNVTSFVGWIKTEMLKMTLSDRQARILKKQQKKHEEKNERANL